MQQQIRRARVARPIRPSAEAENEQAGQRRPSTSQSVSQSAAAFLEKLKGVMTS